MSRRDRPARDLSPLRAVFGLAGFRRFFAARTISRWGDTFNAVALVIIVYRLTGSGLDVSATVAFEVAPILALGLFAGTVVDRLPRRMVMIGADLGRAAIASVLVVFPHQLAVVFAVAFGLSCLSVFFNPAANAAVPTLVGEDELIGANSALWSAAVISQVALAPAAGALVAVAGARPAFALDAGSFLVSAGLLAGLALPDRPATPGSPQLAQIAEGLRAVRASRLLVGLAVIQALAALSAGASSALLVVLAERHLHVGAGRFGLLLAAIGMGAGVGPLILHHLVGEVRRRRFLLGPYLLRGVVDLVLAASSSFGVAIGALAAYGVGTSTGNVAYTTVLHRNVPDRLRGRIFSFFDVVWHSARLLSIGAGGALADAVGIRVLYVATGALLLVAGMAGFALIRPQQLTGPIPSSE